MATVGDLQAELAAAKLEIAALQNAAPAQASGPVLVKKDPKLRTYSGEPGFTAWREEAEDVISVHSLSGQAAADFLYDKLRDSARNEIKCRGKSVRQSHSLILSALTEVFAERKSASQHLSTFYARRQRDGESIMDFSHALADLVNKVIDSQKVKMSDDDREQMLQDQFAENLNESQLRWELKQSRKRPGVTWTFIELRTIALEWAAESSTSSKRRPTCNEQMPQPITEKTRSEVAAVVNRVNTIENQITDQLQVVHAALEQTQEMVRRMNLNFQTGVAPATPPPQQNPPLRPDAPVYYPVPQSSGAQPAPAHPYTDLPQPTGAQPQQHDPPFGWRRGRCRKCHIWGHFRFECDAYQQWMASQPQPRRSGNDWAPPKRSR